MKLAISALYLSSFICTINCLSSTCYSYSGNSSTDLGRVINCSSSQVCAKMQVINTGGNASLQYLRGCNSDSVCVVTSLYTSCETCSSDSCNTGEILLATTTASTASSRRASATTVAKSAGTSRMDERIEACLVGIALIFRMWPLGISALI